MKVAVVQWLRMQVLGMEVPGSNSGSFFGHFFCTPFLPCGDCSIRVSQSCDFMFVWFLLYNFVAVTLLLFKLSKGTVMMISLSTRQFSILGLPCSCDRSLIYFNVNKHSQPQHFSYPDTRRIHTYLTSSFFTRQYEYANVYTLRLKAYLS